jgi:hypothetical protein
LARIDFLEANFGFQKQKKLPPLAGDFFTISIRLKKGERKKWLKTAVLRMCDCSGS